ncbi:hypothetical protein PV437_42610 [Streptomyces scabiei]|uniref:hypothetical protein n=1 Tax=Streptomyces scabiei TaxID=1930 RepID=UPI0029BAC695|nr:hypothetical protein [Streptomyces scabiei]MDX2539801.1 hypothetical protein [Streptomyces scabiei]
MPTHKMVTIDGIRVRAEDEERYRARTGAGAGPLTRALAEPKPEAPDELEESEESERPDGSEGGEEPAAHPPFDPSQHDAPSVLEYLAEAGEAETARVLAAEAAGKNRKTIMGKEHSA